MIRRVQRCVLSIAVLWCAHSLVYFLHEYAHSTTAWLLGEMANPLAIEYGHLTIGNALFLGQVDEGVDYDAIFARRHGPAAALIGFAGAGIGNGPLYLLSLLSLKSAWVRSRRPLLLLSFWLCFMCVGNFYDYVPIRTFTARGDIAHIARGLGVSPWLVLAVLGYPTAWAMWHFFARVLPRASAVLAHGDWVGQAALSVVCAFLMFGYFGGSGLFGYGEVSQALSGISVLAVPGIAVACWPRKASPMRAPSRALAPANSGSPNARPA
ncbi:MAG TPA: hypothetical protein VMT70_14490 [Vicinamibacteria bacterium]|nr:hypothetical protein [Vicinamibacteria bacterium]